jgi:hypothetical protein
MRIDVPESWWAWAAGFLDGEGHVCVTGPRKKYPRSRYVRLIAAQIVRAPLDKLESICGGTVVLLKRRTSVGSPVFRWHLTGYGQLRYALPRLIPHMTVKRAAARRALAYVNLMLPRGAPMTDEHFQMREAVLKEDYSN